MSKTKFRLTDPVESSYLKEINLRLIHPEEGVLWNKLMSENHYLGNGTMVGEQLCYVAEHRGQWLALLGWSAAAYHLKGRDGWIGWNDNQRRGRLQLLANNARFCLLTEAGAHIPIWPVM